MQVLPDDDDDEIAGRKRVEKSALDFANRVLHKNQNRVSTHLAISAKRAGKPHIILTKNVRSVTIFETKKGRKLKGKVASANTWQFMNRYYQMSGNCK